MDNWRRPLDGEQQTTVNVDVYRADQKGGGRGHIEFTTGKDGTYLALVDLRDGPRAEGGTHHNTGHGLGRSILKAVAQATMDTPGVKNRLKLEADIDVGGYAWARMGFSPSKAQWGKMRKQLRADMGVWYDPDGRQSSPDRVREKAGERFRSHDSATMNWLLRRTRWDDGPGSMPGEGNPTSRIRDFDSQADFRTMLAFLDADTAPSAIGPFAASPAGRLLLGTDWDGSVNLKGQGSDAFWSYVDRVSKAASVPGEASQTPSEGRGRSSGVFLSSAGDLGTTDALTHGEILGENLLEVVPFARLLRAMRHHDEIAKALGPVVRDTDHVPTGYLDEVLTEIEKHLPGRHDQKSHGRRGGGRTREPRQLELPGMPPPNPEAGRERRAVLDATPLVRDIRENEIENPGSVMTDEWGDELTYEIIRDGWSTWSECRSIRQAAYQIVGLDVPQLPSDSPADPGVTSSASQGGWTGAPDPTRAESQHDAYVLLSALHETPAWSDTLYRGVDLSTSSTIAIQALEDMKPGDTFDMPLASFTDDRDQAVRFMDADSWEHSRPSFTEAATRRASMSPVDTGPEQVMFTLEKGAKAVTGDQISSPRYLSRDEVTDVAWRYEEAGHDRPKVGDFILEDVDPDGYYGWFDDDRGPHEYISGGRFRVVSVRRHPDGPLVVRLRQLGTFNPDDGTYHPIVKSLTAATHAVVNAIFDFPLAPKHPSRVAKHMPGRHDQRTHGRRGMAGGGSPIERLSRALPQADLSGLSGQDVAMSRTAINRNPSLTSHPGTSFTPAHGLRAYFHEGSAKGVLHITPTPDELAAVAATVESMSPDQRRAIKAVTFDTSGPKGTMLVDLLRWRALRDDLARLDRTDPEVQSALDEARELGFPEPTGDLTFRVAKHLPGRHDQKSHGRRGGGRVAEAVTDRVSEAGALRLLTAAMDDRPRTPPHMSIKRAEAEVAKVIDPNGYVDLGRLDPELAGEVAMAFTDFARDHPEAARHIAVVGLYTNVPDKDGNPRDLMRGAYAVTHEVTDGRTGESRAAVSLNPDLFREGGKGLEHLMHSRLSGHIVSSSVYGTLQHEFGHVLDQYHFHQQRPQGVGTDKTQHYLYDTKQHLGMDVMAGSMKPPMADLMPGELSTYAGRNWSEFLAEARTQRVLHGDNWARTWPSLDTILKRLEAEGPVPHSTSRVNLSTPRPVYSSSAP